MKKEQFSQKIEKEYKEIQYKSDKEKEEFENELQKYQINLKEFKNNQEEIEKLNKLIKKERLEFDKVIKGKHELLTEYEMKKQYSQRNLMCLCFQIQTAQK